MIWLTTVLTIFQLYLAFLVGYLLALTLAAKKAARTTPVSGEAHLRFLILIPAHNEEKLLPDLLGSLGRLDYPAELFQVHVVADNCSDGTARVAGQYRARVHVRNDTRRMGKGYALNWLLERLEQEVRSTDASLFLDADSVISPNFLQVMAAHLERGERVIQGYYAVREPGQSWAASLRYAALAVLHYLRPQGRMVLGGSAGLKGNGMVFAADLMGHTRWTACLTEDIELHMALLLAGERVSFAPDAVVWGEMPDTLASSTSQHMRWEAGRKQMARRYVPRLLAKGWEELRAGRRRGAYRLWDAVMETLEPPFSILAGASCLGLAASLALWAGAAWGAVSSLGLLVGLNVLLAAGILIGQGVYLYAGLRAVGAPRQVYRNLVYAPRLVVWKTWQMLLVWVKRGGNSWIRTKRNEG